MQKYDKTEGICNTKYKEGRIFNKRTKNLHGNLSWWCFVDVRHD